MLSIIKSAALMGIDSYPVDVEVDLSNGLPSFDIVGLPDSAVKESRERVRTAIRNSSLSFPVKRITVNLAPADTKKEGASFDLPIARQLKVSRMLAARFGSMSYRFAKCFASGPTLSMAIVLLAVQKSVNITNEAILNSAFLREPPRLLKSCISQSMPPA